MKKPTLLLSLAATALVGLTGCGEQSARISVFNASSRFVVQSFDDKGSISLPTYHSSKAGEIPYNELSEFFYANGGLANLRTKVEKKDGIFSVQTEDGKMTLLTVDPNKDIVTVDHYESWNTHIKPNNGVGPDLASIDDSDQGAVQESKATKIIGEHKPVSYDLRPYGIDFVEQDGKCYGPSSFLSSVFYRIQSVDLLYNGFDYYLSAAVSSGALPLISRSYYASAKRFAASEDSLAESYEPQGEESYRFAYPVTVSKDKTIYRVMSLTKDQKGKLLDADTPTGSGKESEVQGITFSYAWEEKDGFINVTVTMSGKDESGAPMSAVQGVQRIPLKEGLFDAKKRSKEAAKYNYGLLGFQFDHYYGLKDVAGYSSFASYVEKLGFKDKLLTEDLKEYDENLVSLLGAHFDDGHTVYELPSIGGGHLAADGKKMLAEHRGPRFKDLMSKLETYGKARQKALHIEKEEDAPNALGLFTQGSTAVIRFDTFINPGSIVSNGVDPEEVSGVTPLEAVKKNDIPLLMDTSMYRIKQNKAIKNVVLDLTCNGGGSIMIVPYILAHFTRDPMIRFKDQSEGVIKEFHYKVDLNHDKVYGGEGDSYQGQYKFFILASDFSFSGAHFLVTMAKEAGVTIIGSKKTGGGPCTVTSFSDANSSHYKLSSPYVLAGKKGDGYHHYDEGFPCDREFPEESWYDVAKIDQFLASL